MTIHDLYKAVEDNTARILTLEDVNMLKGKKIATIYFGYNGQDGFKEFVVGEAIPEIEYYRALKEDCYPTEKFGNRAEYWESYMTEKKLNEKKETLNLIDAEGNNTFIRSYKENEGRFVCSDIDRYVYFIEA